MPFFELASLASANVILTFMKVPIFMYVLAIGIFFSADLIIVNGWGEPFINGGIALTLLAAASIASAGIQYIAVKQHHRCLLLCCLCTDILVIVFMAAQCNGLLHVIASPFSKDLQLSCLYHIPQASNEDCEGFYRSDRTAGFRLVWQTFFSLASKDALNYQAITELEGGACCGFFAPMRCRPDNSSFPTHLGTRHIDSSMLSGRVVCGPQSDYYAATSTCVDYLDMNVKPPIVGGCRYDLALGRCLDSEVRAESRGCAYETEALLVNRVEGHIYAVLGTTVLCLLTLMISCCMWWKRKATDVYPLSVPATMKELEYADVPNVFEVHADRDVLRNKGFQVQPMQMP